ncbi:hypothetical protein L3V83_09095 [Thiotrichales bacterium 19X7-9]|nr:hypothetical protein [Thiotrichales bacterium 19X7-9]
MPRSQEVQKRNFYESMFAPNIKIQSTVNTTLDNVLDESIDAIPYSSTLHSESYGESERYISSKRVENTRKSYPLKGESELYITAKMLNTIGKTKAENCQGIALDAHYRCKEYGLETEIIALSDKVGNQSHVVLGLRDGDANYIFDVQHGYVFPREQMEEKLKLWDENESSFVAYNPDVHKQVSFLPSLPLDEVRAMQEKIKDESYLSNKNLNINESPKPFTRYTITSDQKANQSSNKESSGCVIC